MVVFATAVVEVELANSEIWDDAYRRHETPWDTGRPAKDLVELVQNGTIRPCRVFELGCGTGANAVFLARSGFDVTAADFSDAALLRTLLLAESQRVRVQWLLADLCDFAHSLPPFEFLFERNCYDYLRQIGFPGYSNTVRQLTQTGTRYLMICRRKVLNNTNAQGGVTQCDLVKDWGDLFDIDWLSEPAIDHTEPHGRRRMAFLLVRKPDTTE